MAWPSTCSKKCDQQIPVTLRKGCASSVLNVDWPSILMMTAFQNCLFKPMPNGFKAKLCALMQLQKSMPASAPAKCKNVSHNQNDTKNTWKVSTSCIN